MLTCDIFFLPLRVALKATAAEAIHLVRRTKPQNLIRVEQNNTLLFQIVCCLRSFQVLARHTWHTENCKPWYNPPREGITMRRHEHLTEVEEIAIRVRVERLKDGRYLGTSPDVPGLVAEGRSVAEAVEIAQGLARKIVESCLEHGDPLPRVFRNKQRPNQEFRVPVSVS
jgi:predicted RNase H-like HicB family nuclease